MVSFCLAVFSDYSRHSPIPPRTVLDGSVFRHCPIAWMRVGCRICQPRSFNVAVSGSIRRALRRPYHRCHYSLGRPTDEYVVLSCSGWNSRQRGRDLSRPPGPNNRADRSTIPHETRLSAPPGAALVAVVWRGVGGDAAEGVASGVVVSIFSRCCRWRERPRLWTAAPCRCCRGLGRRPGSCAGRPPRSGSRGRS
jgi:hypothetical protein